MALGEMGLGELGLGEILAIAAPSYGGP